MSFRSQFTWRWSVVALIVVMFIPSLALRPSAQGRKQAAVNFKAAAFHDDDEGKKKGLSRQDRIRETWVWHKANQQRLVETYGAAILEAEVPAQDINDISVIQADNRILTPVNLFDLTGRQVQFTPSGAGYTIATTNGGFDANFGTKLNLTVAPAVNPKTNPAPEPGDDAYIAQDLGFSFSFYGASFTNVAVSSNGFLAFRPASVDQAAFDLEAVDSGESLAKLQTGVPRIAPYWHDLDARASTTQGSSGIYIRKDSDRVVVTWNNVRDFPNDPTTDNGVHRFQVTLFSNGRIVFAYDQAQLTSLALAGISGGGAAPVPALVDFSSPSAAAITAPIAELFSTSSKLDDIAAIQAFYASHPNRDVYDFIYLITDFPFDLGDAFAFYLPLRNDATGIGLPVGQSSETANINSQKIQGLLNLSNISQQYPASPVTRFLGANHALSIMGQEQGHRWLSFVSHPSDPLLLLGRDDAHWNFFMNIESTISSPAARRSSSAEGSVWRDNGNGSFTSVNLIDGFSLLDQYLMGLRPAADVPDTFVITNTSGTVRTRESNPFPNVNVFGTKQTVTMNQILQANGNRTPTTATSQKNFRAAVVLLVQQGTQASQATLDKVTLYRLAWESYFFQSTSGLASINTGLADLTTPRLIGAASAASFKSTLAPGEISALFGPGMANSTAVATSQPLPTTLANTQVRVNGTPAGLFYVSPDQINFQVPRTTVATTVSLNVQSSTALIEVFSNGQLIRAGAFQIAPAVPGIFTTNQSGTGAAVALDAFTFTPGPFNARQSNGQPNIIAAFGTGLGADVTDNDGNAAASTTATIDGANVAVSYAGRAPGFSGLNQFNITFPANITSGTHTLVISRNGIAAREVTIAVR